MTRPYHGHAPGDEPEWLAGEWLDKMGDEEACELANVILDELPETDDAPASEYAAMLRAAYHANNVKVTRFIDRKYQSHLDGLNDP